MKIMIVDDEAAALNKMKILLDTYGECTLCTKAVQALLLYGTAINEGAPFELVSIDLQLENSDGNELLEKMNQVEIKKGVPPAKKLIVTAMGTAENLVIAHAKGCDAFLVKPVKRDALEQKMAALGYAKKKPAA
jgi:two-component system, chemotaxis family, chemotaxis protein CheY